MEKLAHMSLAELTGYVAGILLAISAIIQISPIKLNPWSWIAKKIGRAINGEVIEKVEKMKTDLEAMKTANAERDAKNARTKILRFGDELLHGTKHSKDAFDDMLLAITEYENYCDEHKEFKNKITERTISHITAIYDKCMEERSFL